MDKGKSGELRAIRFLLGVSFGATLAIALVFWIRSPSLLRLAVALVLGGAWWFFWALAGGLASRGKPVAWLLVIASFNLMIVAPELTLRGAGFRYESNIQFGYPRPEDFTTLVPDEFLFWKLAPGPGVNSMGFPGDEIEMPKPADTYRILFLGNSCTWQGYPTGVKLFLEWDAAGKSQRRFDAVSLAVPGYTSYQGRIVAERLAGQVDPDLAVIYYGWNDHWLAYGAVDSEKKARAAHAAPTSGWLSRTFAKSRLLQGLAKLRASLGRGENRPLDRPRVSPEEYRENLRAIVGLMKGWGVPVLMITAPTSHPQLGVPSFLIDKRFVPDADYAIRVHRSYNSIVRDVARETGAELVDLEADWAYRPDLDKVFLGDGIHFTSWGNALIAREIADRVAQRLGGS